MGAAALPSVLLIAIWIFPTVWYTRTDPQLHQVWLNGKTNIAGWNYAEVPVSKSAEAVLVADQLVNGEFSSSDGTVVRVFSAKRYNESLNEIGLFVHTPDRCWTESGWTMEPAQPEVKELFVKGIPILFERRVFTFGEQRELVYFSGLVGGQPLPYRLDHNLSVGMRHALRQAKDQTGTSLRASDKRFWARVWDSFLARRPLAGPKQFLRISTPLRGNPQSVDALLEHFLAQWLEVVPYPKELAKR